MAGGMIGGLLGVIGSKRGKKDNLATAYIGRVIADGGTIIDETLVRDEFARLTSNDEYDTLEIYWNAAAGVRLRNVGGIDYVEKIYDFSIHQRDVIQANADFQPIHSESQYLEFDGINDFMFRSDFFLVGGVPFNFKGEQETFSRANAECLFEFGGFAAARQGTMLAMRSGGQIWWFVSSGSGASTQISANVYFINNQFTKIEYKWLSDINEAADFFLDNEYKESLMQTQNWIGNSNDYYAIGAYANGSQGRYHGRMKYQQINSKVL